jgi:hypothetical protein
VETFALNDNDMRENGDHAFRVACRKGHFPMVKWLAKTFKFTQEDIIDAGSYVFVIRPTKGHLLIMDWLEAKFEIGIRESHEEEAYTVQWVPLQ